MRNILQLEGKVSRSRSKHEGESSGDICDRPGRTRVRSLRQLPTDHDYAVPTREYQLDQSSLILLRLLLTLSSITKSRSPHLDRSLHINVRFKTEPNTNCIDSLLFCLRIEHAPSEIPVPSLSAQHHPSRLVRCTHAFLSFCGGNRGSFPFYR